MQRIEHPNLFNVLPQKLDVDVKKNPEPFETDPGWFTLQ